jgi:hypothetical protein
MTCLSHRRIWTSTISPLVLHSITPSIRFKYSWNAVSKKIVLAKRANATHMIDKKEEKSQCMAAWFGRYKQR